MPASFFILSAKDMDSVTTFSLRLGIIAERLDLLFTDSLSDCGPLFAEDPTVAVRVSWRVFASSADVALAMASTILDFCRSFREANLRLLS
jgi:hypothetical protein